ncbi:hypothetical protein CAXC1_90001 [Candidatus Xenohaliotis californiensis]|uniref:Macrodomain effector MavL domain-containing protein n=1 Tax=Candidatus Xenohaliotis californiensis TaxID=84677 RepID=A0ABP0EU99_9RICK|nr:hypothetical protein CAXC1_90001 [Candidatus Xenohaliotis californiensis]
MLNEKSNMSKHRKNVRTRHKKHIKKTISAKHNADKLRAAASHTHKNKIHKPKIQEHDGIYRDINEIFLNHKIKTIGNKFNKFKLKESELKNADDLVAAGVQLVISQKLYDNCTQYIKDLSESRKKPGSRLAAVIKKKYGKNIGGIVGFKPDDLIDCLIAAKEKFCAPSTAIVPSATEWTPEEFDLLSNICLSVPVNAFQSGIRPGNKFSLRERNYNNKPFATNLSFVVGLLLNGKGSPDYNSVVVNGIIDKRRFRERLEGRLLPTLVHASERAKTLGKKAWISVPGLGAGVFSGDFSPEIVHGILLEAIVEIVDSNKEILANIECINLETGGKIVDTKGYDLSNFVSVLARKNGSRVSVAASPQIYMKRGPFDPVSASEYTFGFNCNMHEHFTLVAGSALSLPGNGALLGLSNTDEALKGSVTDLFSQLTGAKGRYRNTRKRYKPLHVKNWSDYTNKIRENMAGLLKVKGGRFVYDDKSIAKLNEEVLSYEQNKEDVKIKPSDKKNHVSFSEDIESVFIGAKHPSSYAYDEKFDSQETTFKKYTNETNGFSAHGEDSLKESVYKSSTEKLGSSTPYKEFIATQSNAKESGNNSNSHKLLEQLKNGTKESFSSSDSFTVHQNTTSSGAVAEGMDDKDKHNTL